ncbi:uncharacterized protein LOC121862283 isoform X2 [Homarus americanus]|uniref:uncharacterized protein LOC121862283 isoform X2 n=1 Tax=Homarus americanus TaxID=6706 RepID=UPI001C43D281|nr:uncharacterized protein LOC121862283 isoform X2 [Homarus americanus]
MDLLTFAADAVFSADPKEELVTPLTPKKGARSVFGEVTNTINISPEKLKNSPLQTLFTAPTLNTPKTKSRGLASAVTTPGSKGVIGRGSNGKSYSYPSPGTEAQTPNGDGVSPYLTNGGSGRSPPTPMSNLKLLTHIASMEESLTSKKVLFQNQSVSDKMTQSPSFVQTCVTSSSATKNLSSLRRYNSDCLGQSQSRLNRSTSTLRKHPTSSDYPRPSSPGNLVIEGMGQLPSVDETSTNRSSEGSRKDKSLGLLSEKFLEQFPMEVSILETPRRLVIDEVASMLGTERRRVYDIINVLESLNMAARVQKNMYQWRGKRHLEETLGRLKALGFRLDFPKRIGSSLSSDGEKTDTRREKSLGILCQKFLMLLLVSPEPHIISLDNAVRMLVGEVGEDGERLRTRGRRLYDIANVLTSLGLVKRVPTAKAFQYVGPEVEAITSEEVTLGVLHRHSLLPSCLGGSGGKENITSLGDHDVTPSNVAPPVQKRGRPRKLSTDFSASTLPAAKRSRLQRTRSEDITSKQTRKLTRHPSLHDICQVAEVEREKLLQKEQLQCSHLTSDSVYTRTSQSSSLEKTKKQAMNTELQSVSSTASKITSLLQRRLMCRTEIPKALTFRGYQSNVCNEGQSSEQPKIEQLPMTPLNMMDSRAEQQTSNSSHQNSEGYKASHHEAREAFTSGSLIESCNSNYGQPMNKFFCTTSQNVKTSPVLMVNGGLVPLTVAQPGSHTGALTSTLPKNMQVIKVITRTEGLNQQESSTVITVLPAVQTQTFSQSSVPSKLVMHVNGGFQQVSTGTYTNGQKVTGSSNPLGEGETFSESLQGNPSPCTIFTVSGNHSGQRAFARVSSSKSPMNSQPTKCSATSVSSGNLSKIQLSQSQGLQSQLSATGSGDQVPVGFVHLQSNVSAGSKPLVGCHQNSRQWQPSPEGSSTDSELEEIFGNSFKFTRPKSLVTGIPSQGGDPGNKV